MWSDPRIWIPLIAAGIAAIAAFLVQWVGNAEFRKNVKSGVTWFRVKVVRERSFYSVYVPVLLVIITVLYFMGVLGVLSALLAYSIWITVWCAKVARKTRNVSTIVSCKIGDESSIRGHDGLIYVRYSDGNAIRELLGEDYVMRTDFSSGSYYIYFRIRSDVVKNFRDKHCIALVEFLDAPTEGAFDLQYDSNDANHPNPRYKTTAPYPYSGSQQWRLAQFNVPDPAFDERQNGNSDFRLRVCPLVSPAKNCPDLHIRKVICVSLND